VPHDDKGEQLPPLHTVPAPQSGPQRPPQPSLPQVLPSHIGVQHSPPVHTAEPVQPQSFEQVTQFSSSVGEQTPSPQVVTGWQVPPEPQ
jgi:hypothetical protein